MSDDVAVEILLKWKQADEQVLAQVLAQLVALTAQTAAANAATQGLNLGLLAAAPAWLQVAAAVAVVAVILAPISAMILSVAVAFISLTAGAVGFAAVMGGAMLGFGAIAAAILLLGGGSFTGTSAGLATATTQLAAAQQALKDFNALNTGAASGPSAASQRRLFDAEQALQDFVALHPGSLTPALARQQEDLQLAVTRAQAAAQGGPGGLSLSQRQQQEDLQLRVTQAQQKYNDALLASQGPLAVLGNQLGQMKDAWAAQAVPLAAMITQWVAGAIPAVTQLGQAVMTWFGERLPSVLRGIGQIFSDLLPTFNNFGIFLGATFDRIGKGGLGAIFEDFARFGIAQLQGLITNLVRLSDWFQKELPGLKPIMESVFGFLGTVLQGVASQWANLTDWVIANWPQTVADAKIQVEKLSGAFKDFAGPNGNLQTSVQGFIDLGKSIKDISDAITEALVQLGQLNAALQPIADIFNSIESALGANAAGTRRAIISQPSFASDPGYNVNPRNPTGKPGVINNYVNVQSTGNPAADGALVALALRAGFTQ